MYKINTDYDGLLPTRLVERLDSAVGTRSLAVAVTCVPSTGYRTRGSALTDAGAGTLTSELAICWAGLPHGSRPISLAHRLGAARGFAKYLQAIDPAVQVPPSGVWATHTPRPTPYQWSARDISRLLGAARGLSDPFRAATHETLLGLLAVTGMRVGEALGLARGDVDLAEGVLRIREAKHHRQRLIPLHDSTTDRLANYADRRDRPAAAVTITTRPGALKPRSTLPKRPTPPGAGIQ